MDPIGVGGLILSALGVGLSLWALFKADSAEKAVSRVIAKNGEQSTRDVARDLMGHVNEARDAAMARKRGASRLASAGRTPAGDIQALQFAQNALATVSGDFDAKTIAIFRNSGRQLDDCLKTIDGSSSRDGWADALNTLQGVIPQIDLLQRTLGVKALR
jgi:hypothetical protein